MWLYLKGFTALPAWEHEPTDDDMMVMVMMMWVYVPKLAGQGSLSDLATMACAMWLAVPVDLPGFIHRPQFPWDQDEIIIWELVIFKKISEWLGNWLDTGSTQLSLKAETDIVRAIWYCLSSKYFCKKKNAYYMYLHVQWHLLRELDTIF